MANSPKKQNKSRKQSEGYTLAEALAAEKAAGLKTRPLRPQDASWWGGDSEAGATRGYSQLRSYVSSSEKTT